MLKLAITIRKKDDHFTYFLNDTYYQFLSPIAQLELVIPRTNHNYDDVVERNDALILSGGNDIDPQLFHQSFHPLTQKEDKMIEKMDFALIEQFHKKNKPIIGICRGIQLINVYFGGTLIQDIPSLYQTSINHSHDKHSVALKDYTFLSSYFDKSIIVNSYHHQNIDQVAPSFSINAISEDGLIEGIENDTLLGVQWHPERMNQLHQENFRRLIVDFIYKKRR